MQFAHEDVGLCLFHSSNKRMQLVYKFILINKDFKKSPLFRTYVMKLCIMQC